jgi:redox-sensitive bicupin YhaK (pirin superfamily)
MCGFQQPATHQEVAMKNVIRISRGEPGHWVGDGFPVRTVMSYHEDPAAISPFLLLDHAGPRDFPAGAVGRGVDWHPHRGFETVTIVYSGAVDHADSAGNAGTIGPGEVQWMTAGRGVLHKELHGEAYARAGGPFEVLQLWVNLPARHKLVPPRYQTLTGAEIPEVTLSDGAGRVRVIAGRHGDAAGPARTHTPIDLLDVRLVAGAALTLPLRAGWTAAIQVVHGDVTVGGRAARAGDLVLLDREGDGVSLTTATAATLFVMHGEPIDEPVVGYGPFVMNTAVEIRAAIEDYRTGRLAVIPETAE